MPSHQTVDQTAFKRILVRNIGLPLVTGILSVVIFVALIYNLLSVINSVEHSEKVIDQANIVSKLAIDQESGVRGFLITGDETFLSQYTISLAASGSASDSLAALVDDNPIQTDRLRQINALQVQWSEFARKSLELKRSNGDYIGLVKTRRGKMLSDEIRTMLDQFLALEQRLLSERNADAQRVTGFGVGIYLGVSLLLAFLLAWLGRRDLVRLSSAFGDVIAQQRAHADTLERQAWQRSGQTALAERNLGQQGLARVGRASLDFLATYTGAAVGALYAREEDGSLRRIAGYGISPQESSSNDVITGKNLVSQALGTTSPLVFGELPEHYLKVSSGLGEGSPRHLVLMNTSNDGDANGVVELGFLHLPPARALEFLELVSPNIGRAIEGAFARRRLQDALEETQQLNEELQVQQEELRTTNEELEQQSRVLEESQAILEHQKAELEQSNEKLADQAAALDQRNSALGVVQAELEERALDLQRASTYKTEFLANMSHELRTPLNSSLILAKLLSENAKGNLDPEQIQFANTIYAAGNDLLNLINDILDISKVEAGKLDLTPEPVSLQAIADAMRTMFAPTAQQKRLIFTSAVDPAAPAILHTDVQRLQQILKNLLSNALKFTDEGMVSLTIEGRQDGAVAFSVSDSGIGIPTDQQALIFEAFRQADGTTSRRYGGTGLGLSISRDLAALLGGHIDIVSVPGKGSTFTLLLPAALPAVSEAPAAAPAMAAPVAAPRAKKIVKPVSTEAIVFADDRLREASGERTVLVVEDDTNFSKILFDLAHELHYRCLVAHNAADGLRLANDMMPDAILLDLGLPDGSGLDVLQRLKENPDSRHIPVHIVSANDSADAAMQLGAVGYVIKPATRERLKEVFHTLEGKFTQKVKRVLLVEDDQRQRESMVALIDDADVDIEAVATGAEALALLRTGVFDCMIIDLKLPDMQGHELLRIMASEQAGSFPPVIVYTGRVLTRAEETELLKYSRSIIIKGARSPERLLDEVTLFLHRVESQMSAERQRMLKAVRSRDRVFDGRRILLVDDDVRNIFSLTSALESKGLLVDVARNGFEALERLGERPETDLVLMDIMMPGMDGLEATRKLRADPRFAKLPVIAITAKAMKDDQEQCMKAGMSDYLAKPIPLERLYSLLRVWLPSVERL